MALRASQKKPSQTKPNQTKTSQSLNHAVSSPTISRGRLMVWYVLTSCIDIKFKVFLLPARSHVIWPYQTFHFYIISLSLSLFLSLSPAICWKCISPKFICWNLFPQCNGIWRWGFGRWWGWSSHEWKPWPSKGDPVSPLAPSAMCGHNEKTPCTDQEVSPYPIMNLPAPWPQTSQPPELRNNCLLFISHPVYGILL